MKRDKCFPADVMKSLHSMMRILVVGRHEPGRRIRPSPDEGYIYVRKEFANRTKVRAVSRVATVVYAFATSLNHKATPKCGVYIRHASVSPMAGRQEGNLPIIIHLKLLVPARCLH